ncbi:HAD family hydrolase [Kocuria sp.]|uniref:HAD family hydrolase n=1 Tax=Kocuria sp. TaxID=1871328 RepID=UPI0026DEE0D9|nr:HAD family phosphatase [Kocuria sp.]MDO5618591.1 HAD family phosphatase [Kocuria sp.]
MSPRTFPQAVLFDHDGTLVDTEPIWGRAKARFAAENGGTWSETDTLETIGLPARVTVDRLRTNGVTELSDDALISELMRVSAEEVQASPPELIPGIPELLQEIADAGLPTAIVTNAAREMGEYTATLAPEGMFDVVIGNEEAEGGVAPKPSPEGYLEAARRLRVDPSECVVLEDSPSGVAAAQAAGMVVVVLPGAVPVDPTHGAVHVNDHRQVTLSLLQWLDPQRASWPKAVLLDHDGTAVNTEPEWAAAKRAVAAEYGQEWTTQDDHAGLGQTVQFSAQMMVDRGADDDVQEITEKIGAHVVDAIRDDVPLIPGIPELLEELRLERIPAALVTNALASVVTTTAAALTENIRAVVSREDVENPKPAAEPYQMGAERLMCAAEDCIALEDSLAGAQSAVAAGMPVILVPGDKPVDPEPGFVPVEAHTDVTLEHIRQVGPLIPDLPRADGPATQNLEHGATRRPAGEILTVNWP